MERGNEAWHVECEKPVQARVTRVDRELARHKLDIMGVRKQMGHGKTSGLYFFFMEMKRKSFGTRILRARQNSISS